MNKMALPLMKIQQQMSQIINWGIDGECLLKEFEFASFKEAVEFVNKIAEVTERMNHHPNIIIDGRNVRLTLTTHEERGISLKDFDLAKAIDEIRKN